MSTYLYLVESPVFSIPWTYFMWLFNIFTYCPHIPHSYFWSFTDLNKNKRINGSVREKVKGVRFHEKVKGVRFHEKVKGVRFREKVKGVMLD